ncbi:PepSY domain-containing protein [Paroceanicella profunda]|uniref:PepSY domain-containing protein n=1 Tax=Paroceanicella profunda TaxID=2579971 RepID=A0A5B8FTA4_9RHOB|nr:PepSY domain-containing protein [Paroceanicella profunda]QDL90564.1 PepSY domain-containing protein [Paroceanicella profunda]
MSSPLPSAPAARPLYQAVWRWHFYAGLLVLPFMALLAVTGALYLFRDEIDGLVHRDLLNVTPVQAEAALAPSALVAAALERVPGTATKYVSPAAPDLSAEIDIRTASGAVTAVYVDPGSARVLGTLPYRGTLMWTVRNLHSLKLAGPWGRALIEITGGMCVLMVATGVFLWWPRGQGGGVVSVRGTPRRRVFWRDLHAVLGLGAGGFILFLAITGMPWSGIWGAKVNALANGTNSGYPAGVRVQVPMSDVPLTSVTPTTWSLEQARIPLSGATGGAPIGIDRAARIVEARGIAPGYTLAMPSGPRGVWSASVYPDDLSRQQVIHLDQYSGTPLIDMTYADYGPLGRGLEWGINVHMGQQYGLANQLVLLAACLAILGLTVTAAVMWWKRRPAGRLGIPPCRADGRALAGLFALLMIGGVIFPLTGAVLLVLMLLDRAFVAGRTAATG